MLSSFLERSVSGKYRESPLLSFLPTFSQTRFSFLSARWLRICNWFLPIRSLVFDIVQYSESMSKWPRSTTSVVAGGWCRFHFSGAAWLSENLSAFRNYWRLINLSDDAWKSSCLPNPAYRVCPIYFYFPFFLSPPSFYFLPSDLTRYYRVFLRIC